MGFTLTPFSGDSGAPLSENSSKESRPLEVLKEQASPDYPPFDNELYGETISIVESSSGSTASGQQSQQPQQNFQQAQARRYRKTAKLFGFDRKVVRLRINGCERFQGQNRLRTLYRVERQGMDSCLIFYLIH